MELRISGTEQLQDAATQLIEFAGNERIFLFYGDMGVGKTTFIKALSRQLGVSKNVSSPTFSIVNEYQADNSLIYHFDFYRLKKESEALDLGYEDYFYSGNYCFIEWPEKIPSLIPTHHIKVQLTEDDNKDRVLKASKY